MKIGGGGEKKEYIYITVEEGGKTEFVSRKTRNKWSVIQKYLEKWKPNEK